MMEGFPGRAAPSMEKPVCVPLVSGILREPNGPKVSYHQPPGERSLATSFKMTTPKWLLTGRWTGLSQRPSPHPWISVS